LRADGIVAFTPGVSQHLRFRHGRECVAIESLVAELAVEAFNDRILDRLVRANEVEAHLMRVWPQSRRAVPHTTFVRLHAVRRAEQRHAHADADGYNA
jgi:hypothetical protein